MSINQTNDDGSPLGPTAPDQPTAPANVYSPGEPQSNGQKRGSAGNMRNPNGTNLRPFNPLSQLSSYTYAITLYIVTPEAANYFANNGKLPDNAADGRYFIVAQSGGINSDIEPRGLTSDPQSTPGPGKPGLDFYIDDLSLETVLVAQDGSKTATINTSISFKITEPIGYTFLTKLTKLCRQINELSPVIKNGDIGSRPNPYQQHYMLSIRFYGYDANGNLMQTGDLGQDYLDRWGIVGDNNALYERLFPITATKVGFKLAAKTPTVYNWEGVIQGVQAAMGAKHGLVPTNTNIEGSTVGEVLGKAEENNVKSLIGFLNSRIVDEKNNNRLDILTKYDIVWVKNEDIDSDAIRNSNLITDPSPNKDTAAMSKAKTVEEVTVKLSEKNNSIDTKSMSINLPAAKPIVNVIDQIIAKSEYVSGVLSKRITESVEAETRDNEKGRLSWFSVKPIVVCRGRDNKTKDWAYDITYEIGPYEVPYVRSPYVNERSKWYGPVKKYNYSLTGENTEVISFEIDYNNLFYQPIPSSTTKDKSVGTNKNGNAQVPSSSSTPVDGDPTTGKLNSGSLISDSVRANIYSISDQAMATMKIMGDPDFLMDSIGSRNPSKSFSKFFGANKSINPYRGQVFIEVVFGIAEDYKDDGLLDVTKSDTIGFYPEDVQKITGVTGQVYKVNKVTSTFSRGKFEQTLTMFLVSANSLVTNDTKAAENQKNQREGGLEVVDTENQSAAEAARLNRSGVNRPPPAATTARKPTVEPGYSSQNNETDIGISAEVLGYAPPSANAVPVKTNNGANDDASVGTQPILGF